MLCRTSEIHNTRKKSILIKTSLLNQIKGLLSFQSHNRLIKTFMWGPFPAVTNGCSWISFKAGRVSNPRTHKDIKESPPGGRGGLIPAGPRGTSSRLLCRLKKREENTVSCASNVPVINRTIPGVRSSRWSSRIMSQCFRESLFTTRFRYCCQSELFLCFL